MAKIHELKEKIGLGCSDRYRDDLVNESIREYDDLVKAYLELSKGHTDLSRRLVALLSRESN